VPRGGQHQVVGLHQRRLVGHLGQLSPAELRALAAAAPVLEHLIANADEGGER